MTVHAITEVATALIPEGPFTMGDDGHLPDERPAHRVHVSAFRLALVPVTNADYASFIDATGHAAPKFWLDERFNAPGQPVVGVTWLDAVAYCDWLSSVTSAHYRLPTEAEREKATRGGVEGTQYPAGDEPPGGGRFAQDAPRAVGLAGPNGYGLFDMSYNIHEWCSDWYDASYYAVSPDRDPTGLPAGKRRASRGGAWRHQIKYNRCAARSSLDPSFQYNDYGFRVTLDLVSP
jgi:formylglycine-generating enzyme required for sulfatase activity